MKHKEYRHEAFLRNIGLLSQADMEIIKNKKIAIAGLGGVGGVHLITLIRMGFEKFNIADFDRYEIKNINRQYGARVSSFEETKISTMLKEAKDVNPYVEIKSFPDGVDEKNIDEFFDGVCIYLDSLDYFCFDVRRMVFNSARDKGIFAVSAGPIGFSSAMLIVDPKRGMSFDEYFDINDKLTYKEKLIHFTVGLAPSATHAKYIDMTRVSFANRIGPSLASSCQLCAGLAATEIIKIILKRGKTICLPEYVQFDPFINKYKKKRLYFGNKNPVQRLKIWFIKKLIKKTGEMPGNIIPVPPQPVNFEKVSEKIERDIKGKFRKKNIKDKLKFKDYR